MNKAVDSQQMLLEGTDYYMHSISGDIATLQEWESDFRSMTCEEWFGKAPEDCKNLHWLDDQPCLIKIYKDENGDWIEC